MATVERHLYVGAGGGDDDDDDDDDDDYGNGDAITL